MPCILIAQHSDLSVARYTITLSNAKKIVLFRLPSINPSKKGKNDVLGWSYYAMEAECPHAGGPMNGAHVEIEDSSYIASCPW